MTKLCTCFCLIKPMTTLSRHCNIFIRHICWTFGWNVGKEIKNSGQQSTFAVRSCRAVKFNTTFHKEWPWPLPSCRALGNLQKHSVAVDWNRDLLNFSLHLCRGKVLGHTGPRAKGCFYPWGNNVLVGMKMNSWFYAQFNAWHQFALFLSRHSSNFIVCFNIFLQHFAWLAEIWTFFCLTPPFFLSFSRLEQNLIKSVPAGAFSAYKKLKRM